MKRIKNLGLAVLTALALTAVLGVAGASASEFLTEKSSTTISSYDPGTTQVWDFVGAYQQCDSPPLAGTLSGTHSAQLEATAKDPKCYALYTGREMKINGCKFIYHPGVQTGASTFNGTVEIGPEGCGPIAFESGAKDCKVTVPAQTVSATYENLGSGASRSVKVNVNTEKLKHTIVSGTYCGASFGTYTTGKWTGAWTIQGSSGGVQSGIYVGTNAISIAGATPKLTAASYPAPISGEQGESGKHLLKLSGGSVSCATTKLSSSVSSATAQFTVQPEYSGCTSIGISASLSMNGCTYTFNVLNQAPVGSTYAGHADIACPAGKAIEIVSKKCTITIPAQTTDSEGLTFTNQAPSTIALGMSIKGIDYHQQNLEGGVGACGTLDQTNGTYSGSSALVAGF